MKIKITTKNVFKSLFYVLLILNVVIIIFVVQFMRTKVYKTMFMSREELLEQSNLSVENIDIDSFNEVVKKIDKKNQNRDIEVGKNIFQ
jgi:hypothetical protein